LSWSWRARLSRMFDHVTINAAFVLDPDGNNIEVVSHNR
jgi:catechol-2,3-dioxygenase